MNPLQNNKQLYIKFIMHATSYGIPFSRYIIYVRS